jgi:hypothetical protein
LDDVVWAILFQNKIAVAAAIHRQWALFLRDFIRIIYFLKRIVLDCRCPADILALDRRSDPALFTIFPNIYIAGSPPLERQFHNSPQAACPIC